MRLVSARIRNYRIHRDLEVAFSPGITVISGPNESGKSTLVEAIHRALFLRARISGEILERMTSAHGGTPEVEVVFETGAGRASLKKSFKGNGQCRLEQPGTPTLPDDEAERRLAKLLQVDTMIQGGGAEGKLASRWAHLWVVQGTSGDSPVDAVGEQQQALLERLQSQGGVAAITQSGLDARVLASLARQHDQTWDKKGAVKDASALGKTMREVAELQDRLARLQAVVAARDAAIRDHDDALREIARGDTCLAAASTELQQVQARKAQAEGLARQLEPVQRDLEAAERELANLERIAGELARLRSDLGEAQAGLAGAQEAVRPLEGALEAAALGLRQAEAARAAAGERAERAGHRQTALANRAMALQLAEDLERLRKDRDLILGRQEVRRRQQETLRELPAVDGRDLAALQKLEQELSAADAALKAMGARVRLVSSSAPVTLGDAGLAAGQSGIVLGDTDLRIGQVACLRITPGNGTSITEAQGLVEKAGQRLSDTRQKLGVASLDEACAIQTRRETLAQEIRSIDEELKRLDPEGNEAALAEAGRRHAEACRRAEAALAQDEGAAPLPASSGDLSAARQAAEEDYAESAAARQRAERALVQARAGHAQAVDAVRAAQEAMARRQDETRLLAARIQAKESEHGPDARRAEQAIALRARRDQARAQAEVLRRQLDALQPGLLDADLARLHKAVEGSRAAIAAATEKQAVAKGRLHSDGAGDPRAEAALVQGRLEQARAGQAELRARADAQKRLMSAFSAVQAAAADRFTRPLAEAAGGYLACVFGPSAGVRLSWNPQGTGGFEELLVDRGPQGRGVFRFEALSGGTREQVGTAMRLAMAQVLAADHDGCLPVVLDDAFVNSDPERVAALQRMLWRAKEQGLQVIVLTCNPSDYAGLGADETISLSAPDRSTPALAAMPAPAQTPDQATVTPALPEPVPGPSPESTPDATPAPAAAPATPSGDLELFLAAMPASGETSSRALKKALGWDDDRFAAARDALLVAGRLVQPEGTRSLRRA